MARPRLAAKHPIDAEIRARLLQLDPHQKEFAKRIGRSPAWLHKWMNGRGHATIDDLIRIAADLIGVGGEPPLSELERRVLRLWRRVPDEAQPDMLAVLKMAGRRRGGSSAPAARTRRVANNTTPGKP